MRCVNQTIITLLFLAVAVATAGANPGQGAPVGQLFVDSGRCIACHNGLATPSGKDVSIGPDWQGSMMAHTALDPYWQASVRREALMHPTVKAAIEDECAACHMPMNRYRAMAAGQKGEVFANLAPTPGAVPQNVLLARDSVSCAMCHQIEAKGLGSEASFTAGFTVDETTALGMRPAFGPFEVATSRKAVMRSSALLEPVESGHVQDSALCGSCHTLYTHARDENGEVAGTLAEQMPYLEWRHSAYRAQGKGCQDCHMPVVEEPVAVASVLGTARDNVSRHVFRGGNFFMLGLFAANATGLGSDSPPATLKAAKARTERHLKSAAATVVVERASVAAGRLTAEVRVANLGGHKLPTAYPSRRAWLHVVVEDGLGGVVFESGRLGPDGAIAGNDNDADPRRFEPHHEVVDAPDKVQVYEAIMQTPNGRVTTGLLEAVRYAKDNRILPAGFDKQSAGADIAVLGRALADPDFTAVGDTVRYEADVSGAKGPYTVRAELWYQPIGFRWAMNLADQEAAEIDRFVSLYRGAAGNSALLLASATATAP